MKNILKDLIFRYFHTIDSHLGSRASILMYHDVGENQAYFTVHPKMFARQLCYLAERNFTLVSLSKLIEKLKLGQDVGNYVALTFGGPFKSGYEKVFPLLKQHRIPATFFITPEFLDGVFETTQGFRFETLSLAEVKEMQTSGLVEFMPQTQHQQRLSEVVFKYAAEAIELVRKDVESVTGKPSPVFAYPKGAYTKQLVDHLRNHNWFGAVTTREGLTHRNTDLFRLPRNAVDSKTTFIQFRGKVSGAIEHYADLKS